MGHLYSVTMYLQHVVSGRITFVSLPTADYFYLFAGNDPATADQDPLQVSGALCSWCSEHVRAVYDPAPGLVSWTRYERYSY